MGSIFGGGGGGGSPPSPPKLRQVDTSVGGPLWTTAADFGQQWANLMRGSYGLGQSTGPASWEAQYLGPGALAMMGQARQMTNAPGTMPEIQNILKTGFGKPETVSGVPQAGSKGGEWNLGMSPFEVSQQLGQQYKAPYGQLERAQGLDLALTKQWQPPNLTLSGADLTNVAMGQAAVNQQLQQQALQAALAGSNAAASAQAAAQASEFGALGKAGSGVINAFFQGSPDLTSGGYYQPSMFGALFGGGGSPEGIGGAYDPGVADAAAGGGGSFLGTGGG